MAELGLVGVGVGVGWGWGEGGAGVGWGAWPGPGRLGLGLPHPTHPQLVFFEVIFLTPRMKKMRKMKTRMSILKSKRVTKQ